MADFISAAAEVLAAAQQRVEIAAQNVANMITPGYRRRISFEQILDKGGLSSGLPTVSSVTDFSPGKQTNTTSPYDIAVSGPGFFMVQGAGEKLYTRDGQFKRDADGRLVTQRGLAVQAEGGGDVILKDDHFQVKEDGSIIEGADPVGKLAIMDFTDRSQATQTQDGLFATPDANAITVDHPKVRQGALESSNISNAEEMVTIMASLRSAEAGQRLINVYDDLMGRAITAFGQA